MARILVVEDSDFDLKLIQSTLRPKHEIVHAGDLKSARELSEKNKFDLIILDMSLPDGDGMELCSYFRSNPQSEKVPLIILSSKDEPSLKALGFQFGADDYVTKPFHSLEFKARVERKLQSFEEAKEADNKRSIGPVNMDCERMTVQVLLSDTETESIELTPVEFKLLWTISKRDGVILSRSQLTEAVYGTNYSVSPRTIDSHIRSLRKKLGPLSSSIKTVQGVGYQFHSSVLAELRQTA